jgi:hypothetical protein
MTNPEFADWMRKMRTRFPQVAKFLDAMSNDERNNAAIFWWEQLQKFDAADADRALTELFNSEKRIFPADWFREFTKTVKAASSDRRREYVMVGGERTTDCRFACNEDGIVFIVGRCPNHIAYHARVLHGIADNVPSELAEEISGRFPLAVACTCRKGDRMAGNGLRRFNPNRDDVHGRQTDRPQPNWQTQSSLGGDEEPDVIQF